MDTPAFVTATATATFFDAIKGSALRDSARRKCCCHVRAAADTPSTPDDSEQPQEPLSNKRANLEQLFKLPLEGSESNSGNCECIWCNGTKQRRCSWCDGKGFRMELETKTWDEISDHIEKMQSAKEPTPMPEQEKIAVRCSACSGSKKLRCAFCHGSGVGSYGHAY